MASVPETLSGEIAQSFAGVVLALLDEADQILALVEL
jgi:hypothetical protein